MDRTEVVRIVRHLIASIAAGDEAEVERTTNGEGLSTAEVQAAIGSYGGGAIMAPPDLEGDFMRLICEDFTAPHMWYVEADLWTEQEGRSDLSIRVRVYEDPERIEISDILVP